MSWRIYNTMKLDGYSLLYHRRAGSVGMSINSTIEEFYDDKVKSGVEYFLDRFNRKKCSPSTWFKAISAIYNYLSKEWKGKFCPILKEHQLASKDTSAISMAIVFCSKDEGEAREFCKRFEDDPKLKGIVREFVCYHHDDMWQAYFRFENLGNMEYDYYLKMKEQLSEHVHPIILDSRPNPLILLTLDKSLLILVFIASISFILWCVI
ncbi:hypothetical protein C3I27_03935 [Campylobacter jejuni]|uniref:Uncharacterized protein n=2 Tax=Campylobacter jejuni TaxID=197 RepID=A0AAX1Z4R9_CAMJU|nr:hypothetical protein C3I27_03935 [Campylobacter jejuni]